LSVSVCPHISIPFSNPHFPNPLPFPQKKNIETEVEIRFSIRFRSFSSLAMIETVSYLWSKRDLGHRSLINAINGNEPSYQSEGKASRASQGLVRMERLGWVGCIGCASSGLATKINYSVAV
jgi:hypothetical protein